MRSKMITREQYDKEREDVLLCGKNRGPHDYIAIEWFKELDQEANCDRNKVMWLMCRTCLQRVNMETIKLHFDELKINHK